MSNLWNEGTKTIVVTSLLLVLILLLLVFVTSGCATAPAPCTPRIITKVVKVPVPVCQRLPKIKPLRLPAWPPKPAKDAPASAWKSWYAAMAVVCNERILLLEARIKRFNEEIDNTQTQEKCK